MSATKVAAYRDRHSSFRIASRQAGSVVLVAMCFVAVLAIALTSYITMSTQMMQVSNSSFQTGLSEQLAEMGLEEALRSMNNNTWTGWTSNSTTAAWSVSGTTASGTITLPSSKFGNIGVTGKVNLQINNYNAASVATTWSSATAYSVGDVVSYGGTWHRCLVANTNQTPPSSTSADTTYWSKVPVIYSEGVATLPDGNVIKTQLRAALAYAPLFPNAIAATGSVSINSNGTIDSYDSSVGNYGGANVGYSAIVAGGNTSATAVTTLSNVTIQGCVAAPSSSVSPYNPRTSFYSTTVVKGTSATPSPKVDVSRVSRSPYIPQFDIKSVTGGSLLSMSNGVDYTIGTVGASTPTVYFMSGDLVRGSGDILTINGPVVINVPGDLKINYGSSGGKIVVANNNSASLELHFAGELWIGSSTGGGIDNKSKDPSKCILLGTSTYNNSGYHYLWSSIDYYGVVYMPNAYIDVWNSGYSPKIYGALSGKTVKFEHAVNLHYDTNLRNVAIGTFMDTPYIISRWRELTNPSERISF